MSSGSAGGAGDAVSGTVVAAGSGVVVGGEEGGGVVVVGLGGPSGLGSAPANQLNIVWGCLGCLFKGGV